MEREAILQLKQAGMTYDQIGKMIGRTRTRAMQLINGVGALLSGPCGDCGQIAKLHRHHENYWPEVVVLLCQSCHGRRHVGRILRHKKVIDGLKPGVSLTESALAKKLGIHHNYAAIIGLKFGFRCVRSHAVPWANVNWALPSRVIARIWDRLPHVVASARTEQKAGPRVWVWPSKLSGEFRLAVRSEIAKRKQWFRTGEISS